MGGGERHFGGIGGLVLGVGAVDDVFVGEVGEGRKTFLKDNLFCMRLVAAEVGLCFVVQ